MQTVDQATQPEGGLKAKVDTNKRLVAGELADRLRLVALGQMHLNEAGSGAFPEWVWPPGRAGSAGGFTAAASGCQAAGQRFQGMQAQLPPVLSLKQYPVVIPIGQQFGRQDPDGGRAEFGLLRRHRGIEQPTGERSRVADVDRDPLGQAKLKLAGRQRLASRARACRRLAQAWLSEASGQSEPATAARLTLPP
jgi:hypothetical protein